LISIPEGARANFQGLPTPLGITMLHIGIVCTLAPEGVGTEEERCHTIVVALMLRATHSTYIC
jgi:hypothetical protein